MTTNDLQNSDLKAPIVEGDLTRKLRHTAAKLGESALPLFVTGEPGTGRRTLARAIAALRASRRQASVHELGIGEPPGPQGVVLVHHPELLAEEELVRLAQRIGDGLVVCVWGAPAFLKTCTAELRTHLTSCTIDLPPLRERGADAVAWARYFLAQIEIASAPTLSSGAASWIAEASWPGNLTQLRHTLERVVLTRSATEPIEAHELETLSVPGAPQRQLEIRPLADAVEKFKRDYVEAALAQCGGNRTKAARALEVDPRTVFRFLEGKDKREGG